MRSGVIKGMDKKEYCRVYRLENLERIKIQTKKYRKENPDKVKAWKSAHCERHRESYRLRANEWKRKLREELLTAYGYECACCGESREPFLTLEHINGGGTRHRKAVPNMYHHVRKLGFPKDIFTLLCMNCNWASRNGRICPHKNEVLCVA